MEEASLMGFSGGFTQGKLETALLDLMQIYINIMNNGQSQTIMESKDRLHHYRQYLSLLVFPVFLWFCWASPISSYAADSDEILTLEQTLKEAIKANIGLEKAREDIRAATAAKKAQLANFFPTLTLSYQHKHYDEQQKTSGVSASTPLGLLTIPGYVSRPRNEYAFVTTATQPIFTGFAILNSYEMAKLGLDAAKNNERLTRQIITFEARKAYFSLLKAEKYLTVAREAVIQLEAHSRAAKNFFQVGMTPYNDFLKVQVELANIRQAMVKAENGLDMARSGFNIVLRRPINASVKIEDILDYVSFNLDIDYCLDEARKNRLEIILVDTEVKIAEKKVKLAKKDYYPTLNLTGSMYRLGTDWDVNGGEGIFDRYTWDVAAVASWNFWEWGRTYYGEKEKLSSLAKAKLRKSEILDSISLEVKQAFLKTKESEKNFFAIKKAIEQAKENLRITKERYNEQMVTSTDVLDSQTLLSRTMTNYFNALYDFKISKASLYKAMGREEM